MIHCHSADHCERLAEFLVLVLECDIHVSGLPRRAVLEMLLMCRDCLQVGGPGFANQVGLRLSVRASDVVRFASPAGKLKADAENGELSLNLVMELSSEEPYYLPES